MHAVGSRRLMMIIQLQFFGMYIMQAVELTATGDQTCLLCKLSIGSPISVWQQARHACFALLRKCKQPLPPIERCAQWDSDADRELLTSVSVVSNIWLLCRKVRGQGCGVLSFGQVRLGHVKVTGWFIEDYQTCSVGRVSCDLACQKHWCSFVFKEHRDIFRVSSRFSGSANSNMLSEFSR